ncbi:50S ribosomal protein L13 [Spiroplasma endosymbiont of Polydrusus pterygomalis]|uniref:50S ribosomal protein L13 n=1 Tax=Spiroplasma endosymbiont of Polydrusus pterygomalis TaxID=3139327 RepID=UPI003CCB4129
MRQTTMNVSNMEKKWYVIDASGLILGRLATKVAMILRGKNKPSFTPHLDCGDYIIIINANKIKLTGNKLQDKKYYNHSQYPGGLRVRNAQSMIAKNASELVEIAIKGMLPNTTLGRKQFTHLHVYNHVQHQHQAQNPKVLILGQEE